MSRLKRLYTVLNSPFWAWFHRFMEALIKEGYIQCQSDHTLFVKHIEGMTTTLIVSVDDILIGSHEAYMTRIKCVNSREFEMKDLRNLKAWKWLDPLMRSQSHKENTCLIY